MRSTPPRSKEAAQSTPRCGGLVWFKLAGVSDDIILMIGLMFHKAQLKKVRVRIRECKSNRNLKMNIRAEKKSWGDKPKKEVLDKGE